MVVVFEPLFDCVLKSITNHPSTDDACGTLSLEMGVEISQIHRLVAALSVLVWELIKVRWIGVDKNGFKMV